MPFYIIGSKYDRGDWYEDVFERMVENQAISVGFASHLNLTKYYNKSEEEIVKYLKGKGEPTRSYSALKRFLNLKPGDLVAVKKYSVPIGGKACLVIRAYAIVVERNDIIYKYDPDGLGHLVQVDFIDSSVQRVLELSYGQTIHNIRRYDHILQIFESVTDEDQVLSSGSRKGVISKNIESQLREINKKYIAEQKHNKIQNYLYDLFVLKFGVQNVSMENERVDIKVEEKDRTVLYEIKTDYIATICIRKALGQLLEYSWFVNKKTKKKIGLVVVGTSHLRKDEIKYLDYIRSNLKIEIDYMSCDIACLRINPS